MRKELEEIEELLLKNGWKHYITPVGEEMSEYTKDYYDNTIGIEIALCSNSLGCYGYYGIGCIQIIKFENTMPYLRDDIKRMQELIYNTEKELIEIGIPFRPTYGFGTALEHNLGENLKLREKYNLAKYEEEDWRI